MDINQLRALLQKDPNAAFSFSSPGNQYVEAPPPPPPLPTFDEFSEGQIMPGQGFMTTSDGRRLTFGQKTQDAEFVKPQRQSNARPIRVFGDNGRDLGVSIEEPDIDYTKGSVSIPGLGKGYYSKDNASAYIPDPNGGMKKVVLGFNEDAYQSGLDRQLARDSKQAQIDATRQQIAASKAQMNRRETPEDPWQLDLERGLRINKRTGEAQPLTMSGQPIGAKSKADKSLTESQGKAMGFGTRMAEAHEILSTVGQDGAVKPSLMKGALESVPLIGGALSVLGNAVASPEQQMVEQAQRNFINAVLRRESGAVISPEEFKNAAMQYFPQPNDDARTVEQKRRARETAIQNFALESGSAQERVTGRLQQAQQNEAIVREARQAIKNGADRAQVEQRLNSMGISYGRL